MAKVPKKAGSPVNVNQNRLNSMGIDKYLSWRFCLGLISSNPESKLLKAYRNSYYCLDSLTYDEEADKLKQNALCKNRWCQRCARIKSGHYINHYGNQIAEMPTKWFMTLTAPTVLAAELKERIVAFEAQWRKISQLRAKVKLPKPSGVRKMECTVRPNDHYHYHYHIIIDNKEVADFILKQWLKRFPEAHRGAQDIRKANEKSVHELFKYFTKLTVPVDYLKDNMTPNEHVETTSKLGYFIYHKAKTKVNSGYYGAYFRRLDFLFTTLRGKRVFQPFGAIRKAKEVDTSELLRRPAGYISGFYGWDSMDFNWRGYENEREELVNVDLQEKALERMEQAKEKAIARKKALKKEK